MELNCQPSDVLQLNVGGDKMAVLRRTITSVEGSMLASRFSGRWDDSLEKDRDGNFFIDQPIELFRPMIEILRARACETPETLPARSPDKNDLRSMRQYEDFIRMVDYYGMTPGVFPTRVQLCAGNKENDVEIVGHKVVARKRSVFALEQHGHSRSIRSFDVILDQVESFFIGWMESGSSSTPNTASVGFFNSSVVLDLGRAKVRHTTDLSRITDSRGVPVANVSMSPGTVVRCTRSEAKIIWIVNGTEFEISGYKYTTPAFSGKGEWSILNVLLD
jgi:hypothetical protein